MALSTGLALWLMAGLISLARHDQPPPPPYLFFARNTGGQLDIFRMEADGGSVRQMTHDPRPEILTSFSPDGRRALIQSYTQTDVDLYMLDVWTGRLHPYVTTPDNEVYAQFSPDGRTVAYASGEIGDYRLTLRSQEGTVRRFYGLSDIYTPFWSPDGAYLYFSAYQDLSLELYRLRVADFGDLRRLTYTSHNEFGAVVSPDGETLVFQSNLTDNFNLYAVQNLGGGRRRLTHSTHHDVLPAFSPDGAWLAFVSLRDGNPEIYKIRPDGRDLTRLTHSPDEETQPVWMPAQEKSWSPLAPVLGGALCLLLGAYRKRAA
jgi:Tol biopolymer transport system component